MSVKLYTLRPILLSAVSTSWGDPSQQAMVNGVILSSTLNRDHYYFQPINTDLTHSQHNEPSTRKIKSRMHKSKITQ